MSAIRNKNNTHSLFPYVSKDKNNDKMHQCFNSNNSLQLFIFDLNIIII